MIVPNAPMDVPKVDNDNIADEELNDRLGCAIDDGRVSDEEGHQDQSILQMPGLYSWGSGSHGQLGQGATKLSPSPQVIQTLINEKVVPKQFSCGEKHVAMLSEEGSIWTWGCVLGLGRPIPLKNDVVCMTKAERGGYIQLSPPRRLKEPEGDPFPGLVSSLFKYPIGKATSVACGLERLSQRGDASMHHQQKLLRHHLAIIEKVCQLTF